MPVVFMENDLVRIGILVGRGSDIFEFLYKPKHLDFMLRLNKGIRNPNRDFSQIRDTPNQLEDYYYGGWQETLPNSPTFKYRGASLGQHGEISLVPWKHAIITNTQHQVAVKLWVRPLRIPLLLEKTLTLNHQSSQLHIQERLINESNTDLDIMWGHHIAFGLPFLKSSSKVITNAKDFLAEPAITGTRKFAAGIEGRWPNVAGLDGETVDASIVPPEEYPPYSDLAYLSGFPPNAQYTLWNEDNNLGFSVQWDPQIFSYLWYWQERYATQDAPWWGSTYAVALEPWTSKWTSEPEQSIANGEWLKINAGEVKTTSLSAEVITHHPTSI